MRTRILPVAALAVVLLAGCTGGDPAPAPSGTSAPEVTSGSDAWTVEELARVTLDVPAEDGDALGEVEGELYQLMGDDVPARIAVTEVVADQGGTIVRFTLRSADGDQRDVTGYAFNRKSPGLLDIRDLALVDPVAQSRLQPFLGTGDPAKPLTLCTCSRHPYNISGVKDELTATFPPLDPATDEVTVEFPGFPALDGIPVTRR
jgi:hypothetical protein